MFTKIEGALFRWAILVVVAMVAWGLLHPSHPVVVSAPGAATTIVKTMPQPMPIVIPGVTTTSGISPEQLALLVSSLLHGKTQTVVSGRTTVTSTATPIPLPPLTKTEMENYKEIFDAAYNADVTALKTTKVATTVTISQEPVSPSRFSYGFDLGVLPGLGFAYQLPLNSRISGGFGFELSNGTSNIVSPTAGINYRINGVYVGPYYNLRTHSEGLSLQYGL